MIEHIIRELESSGIKRICIVIREGKEIIKEYLLRRNWICNKVDLSFEYQKSTLGLGDALLKAKDFVGGMSFLMAIPDQILISKSPAATQLLNAGRQFRGIWNSLVKIPSDEINLFKGSRAFKYTNISEDLLKVQNISLDETSLIRGFGKTVFLPEIFEFMTEEYINDETNEIDFLRTYKALRKKNTLYGIILKGISCDLGTYKGYYYFQEKILESLKSPEKFLW